MRVSGGRIELPTDFSSSAIDWPPVYELMRLFHASPNTHLDGEVLGPIQGLSYFQERQLSNGLAWVEEVLEGGRPEHCQTRLGAVFASMTLLECGTFAYGEQRYRLEDPHFFEIEMDGPTVAPMALVGFMAMFAHEAAALSEIASEYWQPKQAWLYSECFAPTATILSHVDPPPRLASSTVLSPYPKDWSLAKRLWPAPLR